MLSIGTKIIDFWRWTADTHFTTERRVFYSPLQKFEWR